MLWAVCHSEPFAGLFEGINQKNRLYCIKTELQNILAMMAKTRMGEIVYYRPCSWKLVIL